MSALVKLPRYEAYKDSGVEWVGKVPKNWEITKLGACLTPVSIKNKPDFPLLSITRELGVIERDIENQDSNHNFIPDDLSGYKLLKKGQFGMNKMKAWQGSYGVSNYTGIVSPAYFIFDFTKKINPKFFNWAIRSKLYVSYFGSASDGVRVGQWDLSKDRMKVIPFILPPENEQTTIANFLDKKTAQIDEAIAIKEQQISLLKEHKQITIQQAVTQGINPDVTMRDSGVDWIGQIPEHWEVKRFKNIFSFGKGLTITKENLQDEGIPCVNYGEIHSKYGFEVDPDKHVLKCVKNDYLMTNTKSILNYGDFIFADTSEDIEGSGNFTYLNSNKIVFAGYHTIIARPINTINKRFLAYLLDSVAYRTQIQRKVKGVKVYSITQVILKSTLLWLPSENEQAAISYFLDKKMVEINKAINLQNQQIQKLKEYKTTLINSAVTGKIKIPHN